MNSNDWRAQELKLGKNKKAKDSLIHETCAFLLTEEKNHFDLKKV